MTMINSLKPLNKLALISFIFFIVQFFYGVDLGAFKRDYFEAHSLAMVHLNSAGEFIHLMQTIPNSASGVIPLKFFGFFQSDTTRFAISLIIFIVLLLISVSIVPSEYKPLVIIILCCSPILVSATRWVLPEVSAMLLVIFLERLRFAKFFRSEAFLYFFAAWFRQTFIVFSGLSFLFDFRFSVNLFVKCSFALIGFIVLYFIWGGPVPPALSGVHLTPSLKPVLNAFMIMSLYLSFFYLVMIRRLSFSDFSIRRLIISILISAILVFMNHWLPDLSGGGYIFSRFENFSWFLSIPFEVVLLSLLFFFAPIRLIAVFIAFSITFFTSNYMFLKYVDIYLIPLIVIYISRFYDRQNTKIIAISFAFFEVFALFSSWVFYAV